MEAMLGRLPLMDVAVVVVEGAGGFMDLSFRAPPAEALSGFFPGTPAPVPWFLGSSGSFARPLGGRLEVPFSVRGEEALRPTLGTPLPKPPLGPPPPCALEVERRVRATRAALSLAREAAVSLAATPGTPPSQERPRALAPAVSPQCTAHRHSPSAPPACPLAAEDSRAAYRGSPVQVHLGPLAVYLHPRPCLFLSCLPQAQGQCVASQQQHQRFSPGLHSCAEAAPAAPQRYVAGLPVHRPGLPSQRHLPWGSLEASWKVPQLPQ